MRMKRILISIVAGLVSATMAWGAGINYNDEEKNDERNQRSGSFPTKYLRDKGLPTAHL